MMHYRRLWRAGVAECGQFCSQQVLWEDLFSNPYSAIPHQPWMGVVTPQKTANVITGRFFSRELLTNISQHTFLEVKTNRL